MINKKQLTSHHINLELHNKVKSKIVCVFREIYSHAGTDFSRNFISEPSSDSAYNFPFRKWIKTLESIPDNRKPNVILEVICMINYIENSFPHIHK